MEEKFKDVLDGKVKKEDLTQEELQGYSEFVSKLGKEEESKLVGIRTARQAEEKKLADAKEAAEKLQAGGAGKDQAPSQLDQFRQEQVSKAKDRLFSTLGSITPETKQSIEDIFTKIDSGKVDADLIYKDLLAAAAAADPEGYLTLRNDQVRKQQEAASILEREAGGSGGSGGGEGKKKFSDAAIELAKRAGISEEAAERQVSGGMSRVYRA